MITVVTSRAQPFGEWGREVRRDLRSRFSATSPMLHAVISLDLGRASIRRGQLE